jgi:hypothetical protein
MNLEYFPQFFRINYPKVGATNEEIMEIGKEFKDYLKNKFEGKEDKLDPIWNIDAKTVIMNQVRKVPFLMNGYNPALIIHFENFAEEMKNEAKK